MRRSAILAIACLVAMATLITPAFAASNGMLAAVTADGKLLTLNPDGSGARPLWDPPAAIDGLAWSPDGNKLAVTAGGKIYVLDAAAKKSITTDSDDYHDPTWSASGVSIGLRRRNTAMTIAADLGQRTEVEDLPSPVAFAWSPTLSEYMFTKTVLDVTYLVSSRPELNSLELAGGVQGTPAWSANGQALAFVATAAQPPADQPGLYVRTPIGTNADTMRVAPLPARAPRWAPDGTKLLYAADAEWRTVPAAGGEPAAIANTAGAKLADWQPCTPTSYSCVSYSPPHCTSTAQTATTQADQPVDLPAPPCKDPASLALKLVVVKGPEHGTLSGQRYTPASGFVGQDTLTYQMSNGSDGSEEVTVKLFVVPRPAAASVTPTPTPAKPRAPFLTARATPKLDRQRTTLVKLQCDQACSFELRLTGQLKKSKKTLKGTLAKHSLASGRELSLRLRLPTKPKGTLKTVWITGTVRNAAGEARSVRLPVRLPR
jgi:hypothetical protein